MFEKAFVGSWTFAVVVGFVAISVKEKKENEAKELNNQSIKWIQIIIKYRKNLTLT